MNWADWIILHSNCDGIILGLTANLLYAFDINAEVLLLNGIKVRVFFGKIV